LAFTVYWKKVGGAGGKKVMWIVQEAKRQVFSMFSR
jgi:hypothetical protein